MARQAQDIHAIIRSAAARHGLFAPGVSRVALAVSGGADSMCLLHAMAQLRDEFGITLGVAHLNHGVRGADSDADQAFVCTSAHQYGFECYTEKIDVPSLVEPGGPSLEQVCREQRMDFYKRALEHLGAQRMATGHTLSDQAETMLMRVLRGTSLRGLAAMDFVNGNIIRPLLAAPRELVREYVKQNDLEFREDATNADEHYTRNRLRHTLMPLIQEVFNPRVEQSLFSLSQLLRTDLDFLEDQAQLAYHKARTARIGNEIHLDLHELAQLHDAILSRVLIMTYYKMDSTGPARTLEQAHVLDMMRCVKQGNTGHTVELPGRILLVKQYDCICFLMNEEHARNHTIEFNTNLSEVRPLLEGAVSGPVEIRLKSMGMKLIFTSVNKKAYPIHRNMDKSVAFIDADKILRGLELRSPRPGDRFFPLGMNQEKKLQDFFVDEKIPRELRAQTPILVCGRDIVWIAGNRLDHRYKVEEHTQRVVRVEIRKI